MSDRMILALDNLDLKTTLELVFKFGPRVYAIKITDLYDREGPNIVRYLYAAGARRVWADIKLHDTPETVHARATAARKADFDMITVHAAGRKRMMTSAMEAFDRSVIAVTVLTSISKKDVEADCGISCTELVLRRARLAATAGIDTVVCSSKECALVRKEIPDMNIIVTGVRSHGQDRHDQQRVGTPGEAIENGARYVVIGRQVTKATDPVKAFLKIEKEIIEAERTMQKPPII